MPTPKVNKAVFGSPLEVETLQWLAVLTTPPTPTTIICVNQFILQCKLDSNWNLLDRFWLFGQDIEANSLISIVNPTSTAATATAAPTFTAFRGYDFNGTTQYLKSNYIASNGVNYTLNSASHGLYCIENANAAFAWDIGAADASNASALSLRDGANTMYGKVNNASANLVSVASTDSTGFFSVVRTASNSLALYKNGASVATDTDASTAIPTVEFYIGALNNNGVAAAFGGKKLSIAYTGSGTINQVSFYNAIQTLATQLGFFV